MADAKVVVQVLADTAQFDAQIAALGTQVQSQLSGAGSAISSVGKSLTKGITLPLAGIVSAASATGISFLSLKQNATTAFTTMLGSADAAQSHISELYKFAKTTPFRFEGMLEGSQQLVAMGMSADKVIPVLKAVGDAAAASGKGQEGLANIVDALGKIQAQGKITSREIMMLSHNNVSAMAILANKMGVSVEEMQKKVESGSVKADEAIQMLVDGIENGTDGIAGSTAKMGGLMEELKKTWIGSVDSLKSGWRSFSLAVVGESEDIDSATSSALDALTPIVNTVNDILRNAATKMGESGVSIIPVVNQIAAVLTKVSEALKNMPADQFGALVKGAVGLAAVGPSLQLFGGALKKLAPLGNIATRGIGGLMSGMQKIPKVATLADTAILKMTLGLKEKLPAAFDFLTSKFDSASKGVAIIFQNFGRLLSVAGGVSAVFIAVGAAAAAGLGVMNGMGISVEQVFNSIGDMAANAMNLIVKALDGLAAQMPAVIEGISANLPSMMEKIMGSLQMVIVSLATLLPSLIEAGTKLFLGLVTGIAQALPLILASVTTMIMGIIDALIAALPQLLQAGITLLTALVQALPYVIPRLVMGITAMIPTIIEALIGCIPVLVDGAVQLFTGLIDALPIIIPQLITALIAAIPQIVVALINAIPTILAAGVKLFMALVQAVPQILGALVQAVMNLVNQIPGVILQGVGAIAEAGKNLIMGLVEGIANAAGAVIGKIGEVCGGIIDTICGIFKMHSPSRLMAQMGDYIMRGLENGIDDGSGSVVKAMRTLSKDVADAAPKSQDFVISGSTLWDTGANSLAAQVAAASASPLQVQAQSAAANTSNELADIKASLTRLMDIVAAGQVIQMDGRELGRTVRKMA